MERTKRTLLDNVTYAEYDLNLFLPDEDVQEEDDLYKVQASAYVQYEDGRTTRYYLKSISLDLAETRMIKPDFPIDFWGSDFFIGLESFQNIAKTIPTILKEYIGGLPKIGTQDMYDRVDSVGGYVEVASLP
jgi:hypothetical protein